jgi:hypothetical protein
MAKAARAKFPTSFGVFSPTGYIVMALTDDASAEKAKSALIAGGFRDEDVNHYKRDDVIAELEKSEEQIDSPIQIGQDVAKIAEYLALAREGCGFLVVHAPEHDRTKLAIAIVHPFGLKFAEKYNRLTLEELA